MNCEKIQELLPTYQDAAIDPKAEQEVKSHIAACPKCQREEQLLSATWGMLVSLPVIQPSPDFRARFWEKVRQEEAQRTSGVFSRRWIPVAAGFLAVWMIGVGTGLALFMRTHSNAMIVRDSTQLGRNSVSLGAAYLKRMPKETI